jgi:hypothetical protein
MLCVTIVEALAHTAVATTWASLRWAGMRHIAWTAKVSTGSAAQFAAGKARSISALRQSILSCGICSFEAARLRDHSMWISLDQIGSKAPLSASQSSRLVSRPWNRIQASRTATGLAGVVRSRTPH